MSGLTAPGFPEEAVRRRAVLGAAAVFPSDDGYGSTVYGQAITDRAGPPDRLDAARLVPPIFMPSRLAKLVELGREPLYSDVDLAVGIGGLASTLPLYLSAFGSTRIASTDLGLAASRQAGRLGIPMVIGENVVSMSGYRDGGARSTHGLRDRILAYEECSGGRGGVVVQQSTDDADAEVWNLVYSDPAVQPLLETGRLGLELKVGQGAKPGLGGMTVLGRAAARAAAGQYAIEPVFGADSERFLRCGSPGTFTEEILGRQIQLMRNNFPRARIWAKVYPGRDVAAAVDTVWKAGADAVTIDGAEGGTGWAPDVFVEHVGLPLVDCLLEAGTQRRSTSLLVSGRMWEAGRVAKCLALGAQAAGLGRAALVAVDEDPEQGLVRLVEAIGFELRLLVSALGRYRVCDLDRDDIRLP